MLFPSSQYPSSLSPALTRLGIPQSQPTLKAPQDPPYNCHPASGRTSASGLGGGWWLHSAPAGLRGWGSAGGAAYAYKGRHLRSGPPLPVPEPRASHFALARTPDLAAACLAMGRQKELVNRCGEMLHIRYRLLRQALAECLGTLILVVSAGK